MAIAVPSVCAQCGQPEGAGAACGVCGASLLVSLYSVATPERLQYLGAKALADVGPPLPALATLRHRLARPGSRLAGPVARAFARRALAAAAQVDLAVEVRVDARVTAALTPLRPVFAAGLLAAVAALVAVQVHRARAPAAPMEEELVEARPPCDAGAGEAPVGLSATKIGEEALDSVAALECPDSRGAGFFIDRETLLTNAHVLCRDGSDLKVRLRDGRELIGVTQEKNVDQDWAKVNVLGAAAKPLAVGDPLALQPGDHVVLIGSPHGLAFTLHEGEVSFVGRDVLGVGFIQLNATINPGNSGGPLLNPHGQAVGIVSLKLLDAEGIGMALPISYAVPPSTPYGAQRWAAMLASINADDAKEVDRFRSDADRPLLVGSGQAGRAVLVLEHSRQVPAEIDVPLELSDGDGHSCALTSHIDRWMPVAEALKNEVDSPRIRWMVHRAAGDEMFVGAGWVDSRACACARFTEPEGQLALKSNGEVRGQTRVQIADVLAPRPLRR